jgi:hypothetical protein
MKRAGSRSLTQAASLTLDGFAARAMCARQGRWQRRRIVGDDEVARLEERGERRARQMTDAAYHVGDQELGAQAVDRNGCSHGRVAGASEAVRGSAPTSGATISPAADESDSKT